MTARPARFCRPGSTTLRGGEFAECPSSPQQLSERQARRPFLADILLSGRGWVHVCAPLCPSSCYWLFVMVKNHAWVGGDADRLLKRKQKDAFALFYQLKRLCLCLNAAAHDDLRGCTLHRSNSNTLLPSRVVIFHRKTMFLTINFFVIVSTCDLFTYPLLLRPQR